MLLIKLLLFLLWPYFDWAPILVCYLARPEFLVGERLWLTSSLFSLFKALCFIFVVYKGEDTFSLLSGLIFSAQLIFFYIIGYSSSSVILSSSSSSNVWNLYSSFCSFNSFSAWSSLLECFSAMPEWLNLSFCSSFGKPGLFGVLRLICVFFIT